MAAQTIVLDPITRIEGHLRIEARDRRERPHHSRVELGHDGARHRDHPARARPTRCLGFCPAHLRRVHAGARHRLGACGGGRAQVPDPAERPAHPQPDDRGAVRARPRDAFLSSARARLGRRGIGAEGRSEETSDAGAEHFRLSELLAWILRRDPKAREDVRRVWAARHLREWLLGAPCIQAASRSEPHGGSALPGCTRVAARRREAPRHLRRQESASELPRRWHAVRDQHRRRWRDSRRRYGERHFGQHGGPWASAGHHPPDAQLRRSGLCAGHARHRLVLQGLGEPGRGTRQLHDAMETSRRREHPILRRTSFPRA